MYTRLGPIARSRLCYRPPPMHTSVTRTFTAGLILGACASATAAPPRGLSAGEIQLGIRRLGVVGRVLFVAAHPDDENTHLLAWAVSEKGLRAAYLSMTRGDGGQNLMGPEQAALFGVIRTQELLAARAIDGAEQWFTRAVDFGYSNGPEETLRIWGREQTLGDVVWAIRRFQPDVVITRFDTKGPNHGHHTASAILAAEAFAAAGDPSRFPEQLAHVRPHTPARLLHDVPTWRRPTGLDLSALPRLAIGGWSPLLGRSYGEIAAASRSMHKSQGFGVAPRRGAVDEHFTVLAGRPVTGKDPLEGLDFTWARVPGAQAIPARVQAAEAAFDPAHPEAAIPALVAVHRALTALADGPFRTEKLAAVRDLIAACAGLYLDATASQWAVAPGEALTVDTVALLRAPAPVRLEAVRLPDGREVAVGQPLVVGQLRTAKHSVRPPADAAPSTAYWLRQAATAGRYAVPDPRLLGLPEAPPALTVTFVWSAGGVRFETPRGVAHRWVDPVHGERSRRVEVLPPVTADLAGRAVVVPNGRPRSVVVTLRCHAATADGDVRLALPPGWRSTPVQHALRMKRGQTETVSFVVAPPGPAAATGTLRPVVTVGGTTSSWRVDLIDYPHLPIQAVAQPSEARLVSFPVRIARRRVGYVPGAGDDLAEALRTLGHEVTVLDAEALASSDLGRFGAIVTGVRAWNTNPAVRAAHARLMRWVSQGGTLVAQYNANNWLTPLDGVPVGPYPLQIGRDRVTDETAPIRAVGSPHRALTSPNRLEPADYEGWVQERGLYFAEKWDARYTPVIELGDPGQKPSRGALLVARHGKGTFVYTGLALFRQIPAGVPGAYRLLANLVAL